MTQPSSELARPLSEIALLDCRIARLGIELAQVRVGPEESIGMDDLNPLL